MIKKLRIKFTMGAVAAVFLVLAVILSIIHVMNYQRVIQEADKLLDVLSEYQGGFPENLEPFLEERKLQLSPEAPYETRYFSVELEKDGKIVKTDIGQIAAVDRDKAEEYAREALKKGAEGFLEEYRYWKQETEENTVFIIFLDCTRELSAFQNFLITSVWVSAIGLFAVFFCIFLISRRVVMPFAESYEKQKRFITNAGHEIKTPLTIIDADTAVLEMETGESEWLEDIRKQTGRLKDLTNALIYLSRMEEKQGEEPFVQFPLSEIALEEAESFQALAKTRQKSFSYDIQPMVSCYGKQEEIRRLFSILLDNAVKYTDEQGEISFRLQKKGKIILITVFNTADAIDQEQVSHFFDRFYRADSSRNSETGGYGIGLSIAKAVAEMHKGKISAVSEDGKSLTVTVWLSA